MTVPIPLILDLWSLGHSANHIADAVGLPNHKHVARIVEHARAIGDVRAVYHAHGTRILGKGIRFTERFLRTNQTKFRGFDVVPRQERLPVIA